jgi:glycosyltransferase involved in cell wall biosynthesis
MVDFSRTYTGNDLALLIPTKDRPEKVKNLLASFSKQEVQCRRIIVIASGQNIEQLVMGFSDQLPVEYYHCDSPGQIHQRNMGIQMLDARTSLVGNLDDDIVLEPDALKNILAFWNRVEPETAGTGFNITNELPHSHNILKALSLNGVPEPGRIVSSGRITSICSIAQSIRSEWLNGGATIWKQEILQKNRHNEIKSRWAVYEDVIFSYPIGKKYPLYVCADACVRHEHVMDQAPSDRIHRFRGKTFSLWQLHFVYSNKLSIASYMWNVLIVSAFAIVRNVLLRRKIEIVPFYFGQIEGALIGFYSFIRGRELLALLED